MTNGGADRPLSSHPRMPRAGDAVADRYRIDSVIGEGGFAVVYRATDERAGGELALKVLEPAKSDNDAFAARFRRESQLIRSLRHPNTIKIWDVGETQSGCLFLAMELVDGEPLGQLIARAGPLPPERVLGITRQVLYSLAEAHSLGIVHRDLKPDNIMVCQPRGSPDFVKVLDFGVARLVQPGSGDTGPLMYTAAYAAPELLRDDELTPATDIYAVGLIVLEMLTATRAVTGSSTADIVVKQMAPDPVPLPEAVRSLPLAAVLDRALDKRSGQRYADAEAMLLALGATDDTLATPAGQSGRPTRLPTSGERLSGRYQLAEELGRGAHAVVYRAIDERAGGEVAVKVIDPARGGDSHKIGKRFRQEVKLVRRLKHYNTIKIWDVGDTPDGCLFMVMECVEGESLQSLIDREAPLSLDRVLSIARQVLLSLREAHQLGIVHRDLKPGNVMVGQLDSEGDHVKVVDFGIAKALTPGASDLRTATGELLCTPSFAAPELIEGADVGPAADLYSLGLMLIEMLTGRPALEATSVAAMLVLQSSDREVPLPEALRGTPVGRLVSQAVAKDRAVRYGSADEMLADLSDLQRALDEADLANTLPVDGAARRGAGPRSDEASPIAVPRRSPLLLAGLLAVSAVAVALLFVLITDRGDGSDAEPAVQREATPVALRPGSGESGRLDATDSAGANDSPVERFMLTADAAAIYWVDVDTEAFQAHWEIFSRGRLRARCSQQERVGGCATVAGLDPGTYLLEVSAVDGRGTGAFTIAVHTVCDALANRVGECHELACASEQLPPPFCGLRAVARLRTAAHCGRVTERQAGTQLQRDPSCFELLDTALESVRRIELGEHVAGELGAGDPPGVLDRPSDWYVLHARGRLRAHVGVRTQLPEPHLVILDAEGGLVGEAAASGGGELGWEEIVEAGWYVIEVTSRRPGASGTYELVVAGGTP